MSVYSMSNSGTKYVSENNLLSPNIANAKSNADRNDIPFILPSPMQKMTDNTPIMEATATYATKTFWDNFESGLYTLNGGQISPNGKWKDIYTGYGTVGVRQGQSNNEYMYLATKPSTSPSETHAALLTTTKLFKNFDLTAKVMTQKQLRQNSPPGNWETAWIMWNWQDNYHQYSFNLKKIGYELQKKDNERKDNSAQVFLVTGKSPSSKIGVWQNWHIRVTGTETGTPRTVVWIDGVKIIDYVDNKAGVPRNSLKMRQGGFIGLYADDAAARFDNVVIKPLSGATKGTLYHKWQASPSSSNSWSVWKDIGGGGRGDPVVAQNKDGRLEVFTISLVNNQLYHQWQTKAGDSQSWTGWRNLGSAITIRGDPIVAKNHDGRLEVFAVNAANNQLYHKWQTSASCSNSWSLWQHLGAGITIRGDPVIASNSDGRLEIFAVNAANNQLYHKWQTSASSSNSWSLWHNIGSAITIRGEHAIGKNSDGSLEVFAVKPIQQ